MPRLHTLRQPIREHDLAKYQTMLECLQGNILHGHGRDHAIHILFRFVSDGRDKKKVEAKKWIRQLAPRITSAYEPWEATFDDHHCRTQNRLFVSFLLSSAGYKALGINPEGQHHAAFLKGMKTRRALERHMDGVASGEPQPGLNDPLPEEWEEGYQKEIHAMVMLAHHHEGELDQEAHRLIVRLRAIADICAVEYGHVMRNLQGTPIEHFGFADNLSQPLFFQQDIDCLKERLGGTLNPYPGAGPELVLRQDPHLESYACGSYLVFRKLEQNVYGFKKREHELARVLGFTGTDANERAAALVVGRFRDGTPIDLQPHAGGPLQETNNFNFRDDAQGARCPLHAHIRKMNPRGQVAAVTSMIPEVPHRITRRGIPYGRREKELIHNPNLEELPSQGVGLLFMCYQRDIRYQFEFLQANWANRNDFPQDGTGIDPIIGKPNDLNQASEAQWPTEWGEASGTRVGFDFGSFVRLKGGEYFFAPSIPFLENLGRAQSTVSPPSDPDCMT